MLKKTGSQRFLQEEFLELTYQKKLCFLGGIFFSDVDVKPKNIKLEKEKKTFVWKDKHNTNHWIFG